MRSSRYQKVWLVVGESHSAVQKRSSARTPEANMQACISTSHWLIEHFLDLTITVRRHKAMPPRLQLLAVPLSAQVRAAYQPVAPFLYPFLNQQRPASILSSLANTPGSYNKRIRRGRGPSSGKGKTSGRGHKGQKQHGNERLSSIHVVWADRGHSQHRQSTRWIQWRSDAR